MKLVRGRNQMAHRMLPIREIDRPLEAGGVLSKGDLLAATVRKRQRERPLLMPRRRDRSDVRIIAEDAQQMRLPVLADIPIHSNPNASRNLLGGPLIFKQPEPQMSVLHRLRLLVSLGFPSVSGSCRRHRPASVHWSTVPGGEQSVYRRHLLRRS